MGMRDNRPERSNLAAAKTIIRRPETKASSPSGSETGYTDGRQSIRFRVPDGQPDLEDNSLGNPRPFRLTVVSISGREVGGGVS